MEDTLGTELVSVIARVRFAARGAMKMTQPESAWFMIYKIIQFLLNLHWSKDSALGYTSNLSHSMRG